MDEQRIEQVLKLLGECIPRAPEETVEKMVKTVNALEEQRTYKDEKTSKTGETTVEKDKPVNEKGIGGPTL